MKVNLKCKPLLNDAICQNPIKIGYKKVKIVQNQIPTSIKPMVVGILNILLTSF